MNLKQPCKEIDLRGEDVALFSPSPFCFTQAWAIKVFQLPRVIMWGLSLYCVGYRCYRAEQRLMTTLTITTSAAMSVLRALLMVGGPPISDFTSQTHPPRGVGKPQTKKCILCILILDFGDLIN